MTNISEILSCAVCSKPMVEGGNYCPFCGAEALPPSSNAAIDDYLRKKVDLELSGRLKDQSSLVRELGDKAEDILWNRLTRYGVILGALVAGLAFVGIKSFRDIADRVEPVAQAAEKRAVAAKQAIEETASRVDAIRATLDQVSNDVEAQRIRVSERSGEISQKLASLEVAANDAQKKGEAYQMRASEVSSKLEEMGKSLEQRVQIVSKQVDDVSIRQAFPTLGQQKFVTFNYGKWKDKSEKAPGEKWINIYIQPTIYSDISQEQLGKLLGALKKLGYTPLLGIFGIGGPYNTGYGPLGDVTGPGARIYYFQNEAVQMASEVRAVVSEFLSINVDAAPSYVDTTKFSSTDDRKLIVDNAGLDLQLYISR
ncbi:hypothetical protein E0H22_06655 [Rhodopseudomonas boonkerdii]|uniref:hypothetical protein n=1 Tax=Rhodopseudomonas boonkerdii TaxID=475937 RepID=UPI001E3D41C9|nr:hypothetical protein [Rhodopseudomonas boonkerdii]UGV25387.1 hypothetical protein E0H22_06655 [Rhodopseudomonas boonkerdii]